MSFRMIAAVSTDLLLGLIALAAIVVAVQVSISARKQDAARRAPARGTAEPPPPTRPEAAAAETGMGDIVSDLHRRSQHLREDVGWPAGPALARMPAFREAVDEILNRGIDTLAIAEIAEDDDDVVSSF